MSGKHDRAAELRAIADGRLMLNVRNGVTVSRSMLAMIADEIDALRAVPLAPAEVGRLVGELRDTYTEWNNPPSDGLPNGAGIMLQAATALEAQAAELAAVKSKCQALDDECQQSMLDISRERDRAERAEAQLAEARKALGMMLKEHDILSGNFGDVMDLKHKRPDRWPTAAEAARRALEAQGGENGL